MVSYTLIFTIAQEMGLTEEISKIELHNFFISRDLKVIRKVCNFGYDYSFEAEVLQRKDISQYLIFFSKGLMTSISYQGNFGTIDLECRAVIN